MTLKLAAPLPHFEGIAEVYSFPSESEPGTVHYTCLFEAGGIGCSCKGYKFSESCWHVRAVAKVKPVVCVNCKRRFKTVAGFRSHSRSAHKWHEESREFKGGDA